MASPKPIKLTNITAEEYKGIREPQAFVVVGDMPGGGESGLEARVIALETQVADANSQIADLVTQVGTLNTQVGTLQSDLTSLEGRVAALEPTGNE